MGSEFEKTHPVSVSFGGGSVEILSTVVSEQRMPTEISATLAGDSQMPVEAGVFRLEFIEALRLLALACEEVATRGYERPVLVGGAAVEFHTGGAVASGDFDFVSEEQ